MYKEAWERIDRSRHILIATHLHPDGDTLGAGSALYTALRHRGKRVTLYNPDAPLPFRYDYLEAFDKVKKSPPEGCDLILACDSGSLDRLRLDESYTNARDILNIDHHRSNTRYGTLDLILPAYASTTLIVMEMLEYAQIPIHRPIATALYTGLAEDTGFFSYDNVNEHAFICATKLVGYGADPAEVGRNLKERNPLSKLRLSALVIDRMQLHRNGRIASAIVTDEMFRRTGADRSDSDHLANLLRSLATVEAAILVIERVEGGYKVSLRSKKRCDVSKIAVQFGGGGHRHAAGFESDTHHPEALIEAIVERIE